MWDDDGHMTKPELRSGAGLARIWTEVGATQQYYPLVHTVFWAEHRVFGDSTPVYHFLNILLHAFSALLVVAILRRLGLPGAWLAGWLFALHPVMVESVAWITELKNTLSGVFYLGAGLAYLTFDRDRTKRHYAIALGLFVCGLLSKSVIATLPGALLVVFWWTRGKIGWKRDVAPLLPLFMIGVMAGLFTAWVERKVIGAEGSEFAFTFLDRCLIAGRAVWFYLLKLVFPVNLTFIYPRWHIDSGVAWQYFYPAALLIAVVLSFTARKRTRGPLAVVLLFCGTLFPSLGFFNVYPFRYSFVADHFQYLGSLGPIVAAAVGVEQGVERLSAMAHRRTRGLVYGILLSVLFLLSWKQSGMYSDPYTLYATTIQRNPACWMAHYNLGILLAKEGRFEEAIAHYRRTLELAPGHAKAHINLGILVAKMGRIDEAVAHQQAALRINPRSPEAHYNLAFVLASAGRVEEAIVHYGMALEINPRYSEAHNNLGLLLADLGRDEAAVAHYERALEVDPVDPEIHENLGVALMKLRRTGEAEGQFRRALAINPDYAEGHNSLGILLARAGRPDEAEPHYRRALEINPTHAEAHNNLGLLLAGQGRTEEAIVHYRKTIEIRPGEISTLKNLSLALAQMDRLTEAASILENALALARTAGDESRARSIAQILVKIKERLDSSPPSSKEGAGQ